MLKNRANVNSVISLTRSMSCCTPIKAPPVECTQFKQQLAKVEPSLNTDLNWNVNRLCFCKDEFPERSDRVMKPMKNHKAPYAKLYCDTVDKPAPCQLVIPCECIPIDYPRRPRKVQDPNLTCSGMAEVKCGVALIDRCLKLNSPGCKSARVPVKCFPKLPKVFCLPEKCPSLCFAECIKEAPPLLPIVECTFKQADR